MDNNYNNTCVSRNNNNDVRFKSKMNFINYIIVLIQTAFTIGTAPSIDIVFVIQSQSTKYQNELSRKLKENIIKQSVGLQPNYTIKVHLLDEIFNYPGGWTIHNLIPQLMLFQGKHNIDTHANKPVDMEIINENTRWIVFCEDKTKVKVKLLMEKLNNENHTQPLYLGHPLYDREPTIIHHFAFFENPKWFPYPMLKAGVVLSMPLLKSIVAVHANQNNKYLKQQFSIDAGHELARFIYDNVHLAAANSTLVQQTDQNKNDYGRDKAYQYKNLDATFNAEKTILSRATTTTTTTTTSNRGSKQIPNDLQHTNHPNVFNSDINSNVSHFDSRTTATKKHIDEHKNEVATPSSNASTSTVNETSVRKKKKVILKKAAYICPEAPGDTKSNSNNTVDESCAMYAAESTANVASMRCTPVKPQEIYFAVKTCSKYHSERLPVIQATWAPHAKHIKYFSDFQDDTIPTTNTDVPNVEMGHCTKTLQILKLALRDIENYNQKQAQRRCINQANAETHDIRWLFLTDDDTLLSVSGVCEILGCYNSMDEIYLGERYGYRLYDQDGFNYITGGGGIAFSLPVVKLILQHCSCPSPTAPDDMILGSCLHSLQLKALHSSRFHQARPNDYALELLQLEAPISFHKFWQLDPIDVYSRWFAAQDLQLLSKETSDCREKYKEYCGSKTHKPCLKNEQLVLSHVPVAMMSSLHHSKEHHVDL